jgi:hypothetical protein
MKIPKGDRNIRNACAKWAYTRYNDSFLFKLLIGLIVAAPPALTGALYGNENLKKLLRNTLSDYYLDIAAIGRDYVLIINLISFLWPIVLMIIGIEIVKKAQSNGLSVDGLLALINSLDIVVGNKSKRFNSHVRNLVLLSKETAFETITNPNAQIEEIVREICSFFNATKSDKKTALIRVTLAIFENNKIVNIPIYFPMDEPVKSSVDKLNQPHSAFSTAYKHKKMVLISDVKKELHKPINKRKFAETESEEDNSGSMICYPIKVHDNSVPFVVSIHCDEAGYFKEEFRDIYEHSLKRFELRLSLEYSLLVMKENLCVG